MEQLERFLRARDIDGNGPCALITVVTGKAMSAAADLLSAGDYAFAYPGAIVHCHGVRQPWDAPMTAETASSMAEWLRAGNDRYAFMLAQRCAQRFMLRFVSLRPEYPAIRESAMTRSANNQANIEFDDLACFVVALAGRVSERTTELLGMANKRFRRYNQLLSYVLEHAALWEQDAGTRRLAETEAEILRTILAFELGANGEDSGWTLREKGLFHLQDDFRLLMSSLSPQKSEPLGRLCELWAPYVLSEAEQAAIAKLKIEVQQSERIKLAMNTINPAWFFLVALCHCLQEGENELTATDAYWIGIVDEVYGHPEFVGARHLIELAARQ